MEPRNQTFDHFAAMYAIASSTNEAVVADLENQAKEQRITEEERTKLEDEMFVKVLTRPFRERATNLNRTSIREIIDWKAATAAVLVALFTVTAGNKFLDDWRKHNAQNPTPEIPLQDRPTRNPGGGATRWLGERLQIERHLNPSIYLQPGK